MNATVVPQVEQEQTEGGHGAVLWRKYWP
jgi:hypothetical protein